MSSVGQQRSALYELANRLTPQNLKRAIAGIRPSEAEHFLQMLRDAANTLSELPDRPERKEPKW